jgi:hypothetical protein
VIVWIARGAANGLSTSASGRKGLGVIIGQEDLSLIRTLHHRDPGDGHGRLQLFFTATDFVGAIRNSAPYACDSLRYWPLHTLPWPTVGYTARALRAIEVGHQLSTLSWPTATPPSIRARRPRI